MRTERERLLQAEWDACDGHEWEGSGVTIDTAPPLDTDHCPKCGAATHDGGKTYCFTAHFRGPV